MRTCPSSKTNPEAREDSMPRLQPLEGPEIAFPFTARHLALQELEVQLFAAETAPQFLQFFVCTVVVVKRRVIMPLLWET